MEGQYANHIQNVSRIHKELNFNSTKNSGGRNQLKMVRFDQTALQRKCKSLWKCKGLKGQSQCSPGRVRTGDHKKKASRQRTETFPRMASQPNIRLEKSPWHINQRQMLCRCPTKGCTPCSPEFCFAPPTPPYPSYSHPQECFSFCLFLPLTMCPRWTPLMENTKSWDGCPLNSDLQSGMQCIPSLF